MQKTISNVIKSISVGTTTEKPSGAGKDGIAFSDGGNSQNPSALPEGGRDVMWFDFGKSLEVMTTVAAFELGTNGTAKGKGTNGGKPTIENKADDAISAVDNGVNAFKAAIQEIKEAKSDQENKQKVSDSVTVLTYDKNKGILVNEERKKNK
ncbi:hypothetical protein [Flavobacterium panacagri]|uniref:hypothetical protein n=1 Tax=Flavobacterium panacagri TaxID=3034146 RepID=UPI0025A62B23|nr:hypothetical protein [Flavobacterium panacagri]